MWSSIPNRSKVRISSEIPVEASDRLSKSVAASSAYSESRNSKISPRDLWVRAVSFRSREVRKMHGLVAVVDRHVSMMAASGVVHKSKYWGVQD